MLIISRVREAFDGGMSTERAVAHGIRATAGVVTSAAVVMVAVFAIFATLSGLDSKMMGVGLASAVLIDATIVRAVLLPASMKLLGDWNWYLPRWLEWLPRIAHEGGAAARVSAAADSGIELSVSRSGERARVTVVGHLDLTTAGALAERLAEVEAEAPGALEIDLRGLAFMDSAGVAQLFAANRRARAAGRRLTILKGPGPIDRVLALARVEDVMEVVGEPAA